MGKYITRGSLHSLGYRNVSLIRAAASVAQVFIDTAHLKQVFGTGEGHSWVHLTALCLGFASVSTHGPQCPHKSLAFSLPYATQGQSVTLCMEFFALLFTWFLPSLSPSFTFFSVREEEKEGSRNTNLCFSHQLKYLFILSHHETCCLSVLFPSYFFS